MAGVLADALVGDPRRGHPVALFGRAATLVERALYADAKPRGVVFTACCEALAIGPALAAARISRRRPATRLAWSGTVTWAVTGARSLNREASRIGRALEAGDLPGARRLLPNLVGRDPAGLDAPGIARAVVESVAENTSDAIVAPLLWGALAGPPGLAGYRAANTLDAMVGTARRATSSSAGPRPASTTSLTGPPPASPRCWRRPALPSSAAAGRRLADRA